jgi:shikimate dehydrogenase
MDRYVVAGNPVEHSQSPFIHAEFARQTGQVMEYGRELWPLGGFAEALRALAASGAKGCNITVPFKFDAYQAGRRRTPRATLAQAANVLRFDREGWLADNTDGAGLVNDIERNAGVALAGKRVLLIGAGGAAAGVLGPLLAAGAREVVVANRTVATAQALVERHAAVAGTSALRASTLTECGAAFDVVVNASASSLQGAAVPVPPTVLFPGTLALDMMYGPAAQPFLDWAAAFGATGRDGLGMLVEQAAEAFELWRGVRPDTAPVLAALRQRMGLVAGLVTHLAAGPTAVPLHK